MTSVRDMIAQGEITPDAETRALRLALLPLDLLLLIRP